ncbi:putative RNA-binding protein CG14230 [Augochlora pura]
MVILNSENEADVKMNEINESEKKRLKSLKQKKESFKAKELAVQHALKNLDNKLNKNKIIFDENIDEILETKIKKKAVKRKRDLFDDNVDEDGDNNEPVWDISNFETDKKSRSITLGNDERFKIDKRFMDDDHASEKDSTVANNDETDLQNEKKMQLNILENILGVPIQQKTLKSKEATKDPKMAKKQMIRYDPTKSNHKEYEIVPQTSEADTKKIKKKKKNKDVTETAVDTTPVEVSKDIYFSVSDSLTKSLKDAGEFSLLKTFGKEEVHEKEEQVYNAKTIDPKSKKFQFSFDTKNPFKYDSSDDENDNKDIELKKEVPQSHIPKATNKFFFGDSDERFNEAVSFFSKASMPDEEFKTLRQELKHIVRTKIRHNVKKRQPFGFKKKVMRQTAGHKKRT